MLAATTKSLAPKLIAPVMRASVANSVNYLSTSSVFRSEFLGIPDSGDPKLKIGPWPRTKEERERAAKKYNLIPEDYEPYDEGDGWGDYPKLKAIGAYNRDWYDDFDDPVDNKFYGEPLHLHYDLYMWERHDPLEEEKAFFYPYWKRVLVCTAAGLAVPAIWFVRDRYKLYINQPWKQRKPHPNQKYYEFPSSGGGHH